MQFLTLFYCEIENWKVLLWKMCSLLHFKSEIIEVLESFSDFGTTALVLSVGVVTVIINSTDPQLFWPLIFVCDCHNSQDGRSKALFYTLTTFMRVMYNLLSENFSLSIGFIGVNTNWHFSLFARLHVCTLLISLNVLCCHSNSSHHSVLTCTHAHRGVSASITNWINCSKTLDQQAKKNVVCFSALFKPFKTDGSMWSVKELWIICYFPPIHCLHLLSTFLSTYS